MKNLGILLGLAGTTALMVFGGCGDIPGERIVYNPDDFGGLSGYGNLPGGIPGQGYPMGQGIGDDCSSETCRAGLDCNADDVCEPSGSLGAGSPCTVGPECADGLQCQFVPDIAQSLCAPAGDGMVGDSCTGADIECASGLRCGLNGFETVCLPAGTSDVGDQCVLQTDCYQGLYCTFAEGSPIGQCSYPVPPFGVPMWSGVECEEQDDNNVEALFRIPGADGTPNNSSFFDHPYPSDVRLGSDGRPDLDGFPTPGPGLLGVDMVAAYVDAVETNTRGWSTNPVVYFRFSGAIDLDSLATPEGDSRRRVFITDFDARPATNDIAPPTFSTQYSIGSGSNYICDDWFALRTPRDTLVPGHRYIAWLTTDALSREGGAPVARSPQFAAMLADTAPSGDAALAAAYDTFAPLRELVSFYEGSANEIDPDKILIGTVFTTDDPVKPMRDLAAAVDDTPVPTASDWVKCGAGVESPCAQADAADNRACGSGTADYDEYHALVTLPIFQKGTAPYLTEGGDIASAPERNEQVCVSMSVPKGTQPAAGWPLVVYGHGTGGSFRGPIRSAVAGRLAQASPAFATLGFDEVQHGPRRGTGPDADNDPENLFFNFLNPDAARGNPLQGAADVLSMLRFAGQGALASPAASGSTDGINVDPARIFYYGHSQGSTHGSIGIPFSNVPGVVLSGNGGGLAESLMNKTQPVDIAGAIPFVLQDQDSEGNLRLGEKHPALSLLQHYIDPADPINFGALFTTRPEAGQQPKHLFQTFGLDDTYAPPSTLAGFVYAADLGLVEPPNGVNPSGDNELRLGVLTGPVQDNFGEDPNKVTAVVRQYNPASGSDGHFVAQDVPAATDDVIAFIEALGNGVSPTVPAP